MKRALAICLPALLLAAALAFPLAMAASADDGPQGSDAPIVQPLPPAGKLPGQDTVILAARLTDSQNQVMPGQPLSFYIMTSVFGERLMQVGQATTDALGVASLPYKPSWAGDTTAVVRFGQEGAPAPIQASFVFNVPGPVPQHENALFGLETVRAWLPLGVGGAVLAVWAILGFVVFRIVVGIPAAAQASQPLPEAYANPYPHPRSMRPAPLGAGLVALGAVALLAAPAAWLLMDTGGSTELSVSQSVYPWAGTSGDSMTADGSGTTSPATVVPAETQLPVTLSQTVDVSIGTNSASAMPSDVALIDDRLFVLDSGRGRLLAVNRTSEAATMFESAPGSDAWFGGALALASMGEELYIANTGSADLLVISPPGTVERIISPQLPAGRGRMSPAGIAVTKAGDIWVSDAANNQIFLFGSNGALLHTIGDGLPSGGNYAFRRPAGLALDTAGNLYVADPGNGLVKVYSPLGVFLEAIGEGKLTSPRAVAADGSGNVFVSDERTGAVLAFRNDGSYLGSIGGQQPDQRDSRTVLQDPYGLKVSRGLLYVVDRLAGLLIFQLNGG